MTRVALEELHLDTFAGALHSEFLVVDGASVDVPSVDVPSVDSPSGDSSPADNPPGGLVLRLVEVNERSKSAHQEIFSLLFHGPAQYFMPQGIHKLLHPVLGEIELFLVPVAQDAQGFQYEAVFNRLI